MSKRVVDLNIHRGSATLDTSEILRELCAIDDEQRVLKARQEALETQLSASPSQTLAQANDRARYLIGLFSQTTAARDPRRKKLIANTLEDIKTLSLPVTVLQV
jgi:hypothetical protein